MTRKQPFDLKHETKRHVLTRFLLLIIILASYFIWMVFKFGAKSGLEVTVLTWSFFVFCTPIADAGFLVAFPVRLLLGVRMLISQIWVFVVAFLVDGYFFIFQKAVFTKTLLLQIFHKIIEQPIPYWSIILLSFLGTFLSIYFGDELFDTVRHKERVKYHKHKFKYRFIVTIFLFIGTFFVYKILIQDLGIKIAL